MQVRLLGPVDVLVNGESRPVDGLRRKALLAVLALRCGEVVSASALVQAVWDNSAPPTAINALQGHVSRLRTTLGSKTAIRMRSPGYTLQLARGDVDVQLAEDLLRQATEPGDPVRGARQLSAALALWRGEPLADIAGLEWFVEQARYLELLRLRVERALLEARMAAGEHARLIPDLERLVTDHPLDEQFRAQLMLALYRSGRQADALAAYRDMRRTLDEELGIDPGPALRDLESAILRQDPAIQAVVAATAQAGAVVATAVPTMAVPAQLPSATPVFTGRDAELARLDAILPGPAQIGSARPAAAVISVVSGTAGVGKTELAVQWGHRVADRFPDGQLYVNLRGFDAGGPAVSPGEALRAFLEALGGPASRIPREMPAQAALYRSLLAGKRVLVVLDNARDVEQVRPLLPGSPGCVTVVTSRSTLTGLVASEGAYLITLDLLTAASARDLLVGRLGLDRVAGEPHAADGIIAGCARLPLALTIAAARAAASPAFPLTVFATELHAASRALDPFQDSDICTDLRAVFSWSYRALSADAARMFRQLGLHAGPDIAVAAAASLTSVTSARARVLLSELTRAHLLAEHRPGRYAFHDLLRAYATELASSCDDEPVRAAATRRMLDHYLSTSYRAATRMDAWLDPIAVAPAQPGVIVGELATAEDAVNWFTTESAVLLAAIHRASEAGFDSYPWQLAWTMSTYLLRRGLWNDHALAWSLGLDAARRAGDQVGEAYSWHGLAEGYSRSGRLGDAELGYRQALRQFGAIGGNPSIQAVIHNGLTCLAERQERPAEALSHALRALDRYREAGHRPGQLKVLNNIGFSLAKLGDYQLALAYCEQALAGVQELEDRCWEAATWDSFGYIHHMLGDYQQAITCYERSIGLSQELCDCFNGALSLDSLGDVYRSAGDIPRARWAWTRAQRAFEVFGHPASEQIRVKLSSFDFQAA